MSPGEWVAETLKVYGKIRTEKAPYEISVFGRDFVVLPNVFSPKYFGDSAYFAKEIPKIVKDGKLLEIGTGTGIIAVFCALKGAKVVATDINPDAVKNCRLNAEKHNLSIDTRQGNLFAPIKKGEKFDYIFWNHPWNYSKEEVKDWLLRAGFDYEYRSLFRFIRDSKEFLEPEGKVLLGTGGFAELEKIEKYARKQDWSVKLLKKERMPLEKGGKRPTEFIIYGLGG